jgi:hypothetical protein
MLMAQVNIYRQQTYFIFQAGQRWACSQEIYQNSWKIVECAERRVLGLYLHWIPPTRKLPISSFVDSNPEGGSNIIWYVTTILIRVIASEHQGSLTSGLIYYSGGHSFITSLWDQIYQLRFVIIYAASPGLIILEKRLDHFAANPLQYMIHNYDICRFPA